MRVAQPAPCTTSLPGRSPDSLTVPSLPNREHPITRSSGGSTRTGDVLRTIVLRRKALKKPPRSAFVCGSKWGISPPGVWLRLRSLDMFPRLRDTWVVHLGRSAPPWGRFPMKRWQVLLIAVIAVALVSRGIATPDPAAIAGPCPRRGCDRRDRRVCESQSLRRRAPADRPRDPAQQRGLRARSAARHRDHPGRERGAAVGALGEGRGGPDAGHAAHVGSAYPGGELDDDRE